MLTFLHTASAHEATFRRLVSEVDPTVAVRHETQSGLLAQAMAAGTTSPAVQAAVTKAVTRLAAEGATAIVCTCSTLGAAAESATLPCGSWVMRIDRPMAEQAVASGRPIVVMGALATTMPPTMALLHEVATRAGRTLELEEVMCEQAWPYFERGEYEQYAQRVAFAIRATARPGRLIVLAQASMAPAADLVGDLGIPILSSPRLGVRAAIARYRVSESSAAAHSGTVAEPSGGMR